MLRRLRHEQSGIAVPVTVLALLVCLLLVAAAAVRARSAGDTARRDLNAKRALQAAEAGLRMAIYRTNAGSFDLSLLLKPDLEQQCLVRVSGQIAATPMAGPVLGGRRWCPAFVRDLGNGVGFEHRVSSTVDLDPADATALLDRRIVATGLSGPPGREVRRRMAAQVRAVATKDITGLANDAELKVFEVVADSIHECRGAVPDPADDPWTGC